MGIVTTLLRPDIGAVTPGPGNDFWYQPIGVTSATGLGISADSALRASAVWACTRLIAEAVSSLPLVLHRRRADGGRERAIDHPLYSVLYDEPNPWQTTFTWLEQMTSHALLRGAGYSQIVPGSRGAVTELRPLNPDLVKPELVGGNTLRYRYRAPSGEQVLNGEDVFHLPGLTLDGVNNISVIGYARETIGLAIATEQYGARLFGQGARPSGILKHPGKLSKEARANLRASWQENYGGLAKSHGTAVLEEGTEFQSISMTSEDAQFLQTREFVAEDIARWFRVPPHMIGLTSKATSWGTGIEQMSIGFVIYTLMPWIRRWEQAIARQLIRRRERQELFAQFLVNALLRGDTLSRFQAYSTGRQWGWYSANDVRRFEDENPIENGDIYLTPSNMTEAGTGPMPPAPPRSPTQRAKLGDLLLRDTAARMVRREVSTITQIAKHTASDVDGWRQQIGAFYDEHRGFIMQTLHISNLDADWYTSEQRAALIRGGVAVTNDWESRRVDDLIGLVLSCHERAA